MRMPVRIRLVTLVATAAVAALLSSDWVGIGRADVADWPDTGLALLQSDDQQWTASLLPDGDGGVFAAWTQFAPNGAIQCCVRRLTESSVPAPPWPPGAVLIPRSIGFTQDISAATDGGGGVFLAGDAGGSYAYYFYIAHVDSAAQVVAMLPSHTVAADPPTPEPRPDRHVPLRNEALKSPRSTWTEVTADGQGGAYVSWTNTSLVQDVGYLARVTSLGYIDPRWRGPIQVGGRWGTFLRICSDGADGVYVASTGEPSGCRVRHILGSGRLDTTWAEPEPAVGTAGDHMEAQDVVPDGEQGLLVGWIETRDGVTQTRAQRIAKSGAVAPGWPAEGVVLSEFATEAGGYIRGYYAIRYTRIAPDGAGGAFLAWRDFRDSPETGEGDLYAQHVLSDGSLAPEWPANGRPVCHARGPQQLPSIAPDAAGGLFVAWQDGRTGDANDVYVQHLDLFGRVVPGWPVDGMRVCRSAGNKEFPVVASDGTGGAYVAWEDGRAGTSNIYATHLSADRATPALPSLEDQRLEPNLVRLTWFVGFSAWVEVERSTGGSEWSTLARLHTDGAGRVTYEDRSVRPGSSYSYRTRITIGLAILLSPPVPVAVPSVPTLRLDGLRPNPAAGDLFVSFSLASSEPAWLEIFDLAGRRVLSHRVDSATASERVVGLGRPAGMGPGLYILRLTQDGRTLARPAAILR